MNSPAFFNISVHLNFMSSFNDQMQYFYFISIHLKSETLTTFIILFCNLNHFSFIRIILFSKLQIKGSHENVHNIKLFLLLPQISNNIHTRRNDNTVYRNVIGCVSFKNLMFIYIRFSFELYQYRMYGG